MNRIQYKKLEKRMAYDELVKYLIGHKKYRLLTAKEAKEHGVITIWIKDFINEHAVDDKETHVIYVKDGKEHPISKLVKFPVYVTHSDEYTDIIEHMNSCCTANVPPSVDSIRTLLDLIGESRGIK